LSIAADLMKVRKRVSCTWLSSASPVRASWCILAIKRSKTPRFLGQCGSLFTERHLKSVLLHLGSTQVHGHERLEIGVLVTAELRCSL
jgi:hypothetical protein